MFIVRATLPLLSLSIFQLSVRKKKKTIFTILFGVEFVFQFNAVVVLNCVGKCSGIEFFFDRLYFFGKILHESYEWIWLNCFQWNKRHPPFHQRQSLVITVENSSTRFTHTHTNTNADTKTQIFAFACGAFVVVACIEIRCFITFPIEEFQ